VAELKTKPTTASVERFLSGIADEEQQADARTLLELMRTITKAEPKLWGSSIVGFGDYHYKYASGREGDWFTVGFSPRKQNLTLYIMAGFDEYKTLLKDLGKHKTGKSCLYINRLSDVNPAVLRKLIRDSVRHVRAGQRQPGGRR
jgi:hypothetical protein